MSDVPIVIADSAAKWGGKCRHCQKWLDRGEHTFKVAPSCCVTHRVKKSRAKNGPGSWVCSACMNRVTDPRYQPMTRTMKIAIETVLAVFPGSRVIS